MNIRYKYLRNSEHFIHWINKAVELSGEVIDKSKILPEDFYERIIYDSGLAEKFTWDLKSDIHLIEERNVLRWVSDQKLSKGAAIFPKSPTYDYKKFSPEFKDICSDLYKKSGVYSFWTDEEIPLYIGKSINLGTRIPESFGQSVGRSRYPRTTYLRYILTTQSDCGILELYLIAKLKPSLNSEGKFSDATDLNIKVPEWSNPYKIMSEL